MLKTHLFFLVVNVILLSPFKANRFEVGDRPISDPSSCDVQCNSTWGKVPWLNVPWARSGRSQGSECVCRFNHEDLYPFVAKRTCVQKYVFAPLKSKKKYAKKAIEATVVRFDLKQRFESYKKTYNKIYKTRTEDLQRFEIYKRNLVEIDRLMATRTGDVVYGEGPYTDLTSEEWMDLIGVVKLKPARSQRLQTRMLSDRFSRLSTNPSQGGNRNWNRGESSRRGESSFSRGRSPAPTPRSSRRSTSRSVPPSWAPVEFVDRRPIIGRTPRGLPTNDWRVPAKLYPQTETQNVFGRKCGACWAFAVLGAIEILLARVQGYLTSLSKQALIDCVTKNDGCDGGDMGDALDHIIENGVPSAAAYPYAGRKGTCRGYVKAYMKIHYYTPFENATPEEIEGHLEHSPLPSILYSPKELQFYVSGVYDSAACRNDKRLINHAAVIVGQYDDAWIVRFSVISDWGLQGHVLIAKGRCGLGLQSYEINSPFTIIK